MIGPQAKEYAPGTVPARRVKENSPAIDRWVPKAERQDQSRQGRKDLPNAMYRVGEPKNRPVQDATSLSPRRGLGSRGIQATHR